MAFNLSTFALEIFNFLILVWILQRLFYKPVQNVIQRRQRKIDQSLAEAAKMRQEANELKQSYENRLQHWEQEKQAALGQLHQQLETEKQQQLIALQQEIKQQRSKSEKAQQRRLQELQRHQQKLALQNGSRFATLLLQQAAGPELEKRLFKLLLNQLQDLPSACRQSLQLLEHKKNLAIRIHSVYPLSNKQLEQLQEKLTSLINRPLHFNYHQKPELIAGLEIDIGAWVLHANLQHELRGFTEISDDF